MSNTVRRGSACDSSGNTAEPEELLRVDILLDRMPWLVSRFTHAELATMLREPVDRLGPDSTREEIAADLLRYLEVTGGSAASYVDFMERVELQWVTQQLGKHLPKAEAEIAAERTADK